MSKAFTRESDDSEEIPSLPRQFLSSSLGAKTYLTPDGASRFREELRRLVEEDRPRLAPSSEDPDAKRKRQLLDAQISHLSEVLASAIIISPPEPSDDRIRFGAIVRVRDRSSGPCVYRIVGVHETDFDRGYISFLSPIAKALLNRRSGEKIHYQVPDGEEHLEILGISYP